MGADLDGDGDGEGDVEGRTQRRLAQNREAARKSRQRRKLYVGRLEARIVPALCDSFSRGVVCKTRPHSSAHPGRLTLVVHRWKS